MTHLFPYDNTITGLLVLIVGFAFHWIGQALSIINWDLAIRLGLQESEAPPEYKVYEHGIAVADVAIGWVYAVAGIGLLFGAPWAYRIAWIPGAILIYHAISFWAWTGNQLRAGQRLPTGRTLYRFTWIAANLLTGGLAILLAWNAT